jgi:ABC-2 type transport system ATP-binding protein
MELTKRFGKFTAVDRLTFSVPAGKVFGFLGANGAGRPRPSACSAGSLTPTSGSGSVAGFDIIRETARIRGRIGYMSQKFSLYGDLTVKGQPVFLFGSIYGLSGKKLAATDRCDGVVS